MARRKADLPSAQAIAALADAQGRLAVRVTPGAREEGLHIVGGKLHAKVRAKPEDGKANAAVVALVAAGLGIGGTQVALLRGATSREKVLRLGS